MTHRGTIQVVDDERECLTFLCGILASDGYRVRPAESGAMALESAAAETPELILLDTRMPAMDGFEVCRRLKADDRCRSVPLIFLCAPYEADTVEGLRLGAVDFLYKPFRAPEVLARVSSHLEWGRMHTDLTKLVASGRLPLANGQTPERECSERTGRSGDANLPGDLEGLGLLASCVAHDFNNFLSSILVNSDIALEELETGTSVRGEIESIRTAALRAAEVVSQFMNYAVHRTVEFEPTDLPSLVSEMAGLMRGSVSKTCRIHTDVLRLVPPVRANPAQIRQVVLNLIKNASDAIGACEGTITLRVAPARVQEGDARLPSGEYVSLEVADTGCGMTDETQARIFDPFFTTKFEGRGLGLATLRSIVAGHGGIIDVSSRPGHGTAFRVVLPCWREVVAAPAVLTDLRIA